MSGANLRLATGQQHKYYLSLTLFLLSHVSAVFADKYVGCLLNQDVCDDGETCFNDFAFGRCVSTSEENGEEYLYRFPTLSTRAESFLEDEVSRLYQHGFVWTDDYTQCILQTALAAIKDQTEYDTLLCDALLTNDNVNLGRDTGEMEEDLFLPPQTSYLYGNDEPMILELQPSSINDDDTSDDQIDDNDILEDEPLQLERIQDLPLQRTKFYDFLTAEDDFYPDTFEQGQDETYEDTAADFDTDDIVFDRRHQRMDVKKPGPFFEASPNNFYLDKLAYRYDTDNADNNVTNQIHNNDEDNDGQQEYEFPLSTSEGKEKRAPSQEMEQQEEGGGGGNKAADNYVHISLNNKFQTWREGNNFINALAEEMGLPAHALSDPTIEKQHVQFKVEPNVQNVDAARIAEALNEDINIQKRLTNNMGVDIALAASGKKDDRASVFPHGKNLKLLILVVVGASATASIVVGGLIFALASRRRGSKKVSKLQLSDDVEDRGKVHEEYKQLCRDWSKSSQNPGESNKNGGKPMLSSVTRLQSHDSKESNSNRSSTSSWSDEPVNNSMDISTGHMVLAYMEDHLKNKQRLEQEWVGLCGYEAEPSSTTVAFKAEHKKKNRYPDKLPYDHNRVILNALVNGANSDYINASTVTDHDPRNPSYIVSQGPLGQTVSDFWQMVWEQGCVVIVMLTRLQDNGCQLCTRYWPEEGSDQYHIFEVHLVSEHVWCEDYLVRSVYLKNTRTGETRTVTQFHFRSWPAHGVPSSTKALLEFRRKVNKSYRGRSCPIIVHCSDGVGRSGTYVLIDMVLNRLSKGCKEIDIAATLEHIRDQRGGMVQNRQQFEFCLMAVAEEVHAILKALPQ